MALKLLQIEESFCFVAKIHTSLQRHVVNKQGPLWKKSAVVVEVQNIFLDTFQCENI